MSCDRSISRRSATDLRSGVTSRCRSGLGHHAAESISVEVLRFTNVAIPSTIGLHLLNLAHLRLICHVTTSLALAFARAPHSVIQKHSALNTWCTIKPPATLRCRAWLHTKITMQSVAAAKPVAFMPSQTICQRPCRSLGRASQELAGGIIPIGACAVNRNPLRHR